MAMDGIMEALLRTLMVVLAFAVPHHHHPTKHHPTHHHHVKPNPPDPYAWAWTITPFDRCVYTAESSGEWWASNGADFSYYQWEFDAYGNTWVVAQRAIGVFFSTDPRQATLEQQTYVFNVWEPGRYPGGVSHRGAWPVTVPECGG